MGEERSDSFGDRQLVNIELAPIAVSQRILGWRQLAPMWAVIGMSPGIYSFACSKLPVAPALLALAVGLGATALLGVALSWSAARFGIGFTPLCRAAFGARGAALPILLRWLVGVVWLGLWASHLGSSMVAVAATMRGTPAFLHTQTGQDAVGWGIGGVLILAAWLVARGGMSRVSWVAMASVLSVILVSFALVVYAGITSKGFGTWVGRSVVWSVPDLFGAVARVIGLTLPALIACSDWERFRRGRDASTPAIRRSLLDTLSPASIVPVGVALGFVGALLASASHAVCGQAAGGPIADAVGFGEVPGGVAAVVLVGCMWLGAAPLVGMYSSGLAACGLAPRRFSYHVGLVVTALGALAIVPVARAVADLGIEASVVLLVLAAPFGVLLVDELVVRRGRVLLEELYLFSRDYGPVGGVTLSAILALAIGWLLHPELLPRLLAHAPASLHQLSAFLGRVQPNVLALAGAALAAGAVYVLLAPLERLVLAGRRRPATGAKPEQQGKKRKRKGKRKKGKKKPAHMELSDTAGLTDPHFVAGEGGSGRKRMKTLESDTYELSSADLSLLSGSVDQVLADPLSDTRRDTQESQPGVGADGETVSGPRKLERRSTEEQRMDSDWDPDEDKDKDKD